MPTPTETIVPCPSDMEATQYVHKISGILVNARPIAFKIRGDEVEPIWYPRLDESWEEVTRLPSGYYSACGREALNIQALCSAIKDGRH